jgi:hypothetical protein
MRKFEERFYGEIMVAPATMSTQPETQEKRE